MGIFEKGKRATPLAPLTAEVAQEIYALFDNHTYGDVNLTNIFTKHGYNLVYGKQTLIESKRLQSEAIAYCIANEEVTAQSMIADITSDLLDTSVVGLDIIHYNPTFDADRTFNEFRAAYPYVAPPVVEEPEE